MLSIPYLLSIITFLPLLGAIVVAVVGGDSAKKVTGVGHDPGHLCGQPAAAGSTGTTVRPACNSSKTLPWFPTLSMRYAMGVDGISLFLVLLTTLLMPIAVYFSNLYVNENSRAYTWR